MMILTEAEITRRSLINYIRGSRRAIFNDALLFGKMQVKIKLSREIPTPISPARFRLRHRSESDRTSRSLPSLPSYRTVIFFSFSSSLFAARYKRAYTLRENKFCIAYDTFL